MAPPELARDAPVVDVLHPVEIGLLVHLRREPDGLFAVGVGLDGGNRLVGQRLNLDEPLRRQPRLDHGLAAVAVAHVVHVILDARQEPLRFKIRDDFLARHIAIEARVGPAFVVDVRACRPSR